MKLDVFTFRVCVCFILSFLIGFERQYRHKMVGLRTNVLVSLGAFLFVTASYKLVPNDMSRIAAQVVSGIGFLGAGVILREGSKIKGLNTAATLWCVASIGVLSACGMVYEAAIGTGLVLMSNILLRMISLAVLNKVKKLQKEKCTLRISCNNDIEVVVRTSLAKAIEKNNLSLQSLERSEITKKEVKLKAIIVTTRPDIVEDIVKNISAEPGVTSISFEHIKQIESDNQDDGEEDVEE